MRVGIFTTAYPGVNGTGGIPVYSKSLATGLVALGHEAHVLVHDDKEELERTFQVDGVHLHTVATKHFPVISRWLRGSRENVETSVAALRIARRHRLDVFEFPNYDAMGVPFVASHLGPPTVVRLHTSTKECLVIEKRQPQFSDRFDVLREWAQCRLANALVVSTAAHREHMAKELGIDAERIGLVPLGIPDDAPRELHEPRPRSTPPTVVYLGRFEPRKGTIEMFQAVPRVLARVPEARFVFCGQDKPHAPGNILYADWIKQNLPETARARIEMTGFVDDATRDRVVASGDIFVAPSLYESFGLIFLEAMRMAVPCIGTTAGGIPEVVEHERTGLLVPPKDSERLADAIVRLLLDEPERLRMAAAGRRRFEEKFSSRAMAERTVAHHEAVLARARQGRLRGTSATS
jgi:glycosyltransferase involved in cell wall biosynthesis